MEILNYIINEDQEGQRIDKYLSINIEGKSRSFIQGLIDEKKVMANDKIIKSNYKLKNKDLITVEMPDPVELNVEPEKMGSPGQTRTGNQETHDVENDVAAFPAFQPVVFQLVFGHNGNRVVKVGICLILFIRLRWLVVIRSKCRLLEYGQWSVAVRHSAAGCRHRAGPSEWPVGSYTGSA